MGFSVKNPVPEFTSEYITARAASEFSGYNQQYIRRLLRGAINIDAAMYSLIPEDVAEF